VRLATELVGVANAVRDVRDILQRDLAVMGRIEDHERRIVAIESQGG
jgi:hypothetical protein